MLKIEKLSKKYDQFALECSLEVMPGYVTGLVGQNGAGKSTTFKSILGLISIDGGQIQMFGKDIRELNRKERQKIGVVLADSGFSGYLTVKDVIPVLVSMYEQFD